MRGLPPALAPESRPSCTAGSRAQEDRTPEAPGRGSHARTVCCPPFPQGAQHTDKRTHWGLGRPHPRPPHLPPGRARALQPGREVTLPAPPSFPRASLGAWLIQGAEGSSAARRQCLTESLHSRAILACHRLPHTGWLSDRSDQGRPGRTGGKSEPRAQLRGALPPGE